MARAEDSPFLYDFKLATLNAKRTPPRITPNLMADMLPVNMKERNPQTERMKPAKPNPKTRTKSIYLFKYAIKNTKLNMENNSHVNTKYHKVSQRESREFWKRRLSHRLWKNMFRLFL